MKYNILIILAVFGFAVTGISIFFYLNPPFAYYDLEIHGMKDTYHTGEEYSFYYTLSGYGNTCGAWLVSFPDKNGTIQHRGEVIDCTEPTNKQLSHDSVKFRSKAPLIPGKYNVTVSLENIEPVIHEFMVLPQNGKTEHTKIEKLLAQNQISHIPDTLAVAGGITFGGGDPGCGAVMDYDSNVHWFKVDSISNPANMTLYDENPVPCKINHGSCFCNAQTAFTEVMTSELSYLNSTEEEQIGQRVKTYLETMPHQIPVTKFVVGKYNLDLGEQYTEICGILLTKGDRGDRFNEECSVYKYFSAAKEGMRLWDFSLTVGSEKLCAISDDARIFEYEQQER